MVSYERDTRIPYRLGTDRYCKFRGRDEYVHMGDFVCVDQDTGCLGRFQYCGELCGVEYDGEGFICAVKLLYPDKVYGYYVAFDGAFYHAEKVSDRD